MDFINVFFEFDTKEQWLKFGRKFMKRNDFLKHTPCLTRYLNERNLTFEDLVNGCYNFNEPYMIGVIAGVLTESETVLKSVLEFIHENHYENYYEFRDNYGSRLVRSEVIKQYNLNCV